MEALLEKYWNAETNQNEEAILKDYMLSAQVANELLYAVPYFKNVIDVRSTSDVDSRIISKMLDKYFDGESSLEEEALLKEYFEQESVSQELRKYKGMFNAFSREANMVYTKDLLLPKESKVISINQDDKKKSIPIIWLKVASAAMLVGVIGYFIIKNNSNASSSQPKMALAARHIEPQTPEEALEVTIQALAMVSKKYKKGEENLLEGMKTMNEKNIMKE